MKQKLLVVKDATISYNTVTVLSHLNFEVEDGGWIQIQGFNGEGKTTFVKTLLHLLPYSGSILLKGKELREYSFKEIHNIFSYLPQRLDSVPNITLSDFLSLYPSDKKDRVINQLNLSTILSVPLPSLSLGQLQLSLLAQALLSDSEILVLDEPTSSIDIQNKELILSVVKDYVIQGKTVFYISHDVEKNYYLPDNIITLSNSKAYTSRVIVKNRVEKQKDSLPVPKILYPVIVTSLLVIISFLIPSETPVLLRVVWAIISGCVLSFTGAIFQTIFQNPLASPYTLGLASGSSVGALSAFLLGITSLFGTSISACLGGFSSSLLLLLAHKNRIKDRSFLLLCGIAYASFVTSASMLLQSYVDTTTAQSYIRWMLGGLDITEYYSLFLAPIALLSLLPIVFYLNQVTSLGIDSDISQVQGIPTARIRNISLLFSTVAISIVVSQTGPLSFVGLVIPNIIRRKYGIALRKTIPITLLIGISFTLLSDIITRIANLYTVPVTTGVVMAILGSPVLIYVLFKTELKNGY